MIDGDPDLGQDAINQERDWFASEGRAVFPAQIVHGRHRDRHDPLSLRQSSCKCLTAAGGFLIGERVDDLEVHRGTQFDTGAFADHLGPMPVFTRIPLRPASQRYQKHILGLI